MTEDRFDHAVLIGICAILPISGVALLLGGATGHISITTALFFSLLATAGTAAAVHEIRATAHNRARMVITKTTSVKYVPQPERPTSWRERIQAANEEMGIRLAR